MNIKDQIEALETEQFSLTWEGKSLIGFWINTLDPNNPEKFSCSVDFEETPEAWGVFKRFIELEKHIRELESMQEKNVIQISVPYTEKILTLEAFESDYLPLVQDGQYTLEEVIQGMYETGYNMEVFEE